MKQNVSRLKIALLQFPGSNCDQDCLTVFSENYQLNLVKVSCKNEALPMVDAVIVPGGFSYGDYLRAGALAAAAPILEPLKDFARGGGAIIGICNGFQILTEAGLLPGVLLPNRDGNFICESINLRVGSGNSGYHRELKEGSTLQIPIAHAEGRYFAEKEQLGRLESKGQILFRYASRVSESAHEAYNPNGSEDNIAGIISEDGRILGMMPHPERATDKLLGGSADGLKVLDAFLASLL